LFTYSLIIGVYLNNVRQQFICLQKYVFIEEYPPVIYPFFIEEMPDLLDLPDEMILAIFNQIKPEILLLSSIFGIGNTRLEQLALTKCHSLDLTFDYHHPVEGSPIERFYCDILPYISNNIRCLLLNLIHLLHTDTIVRNCIGEMIFNLTHLKIILCRYHPKSGKRFEIGKLFSQFEIVYSKNIFADQT